MGPYALIGQMNWFTDNLAGFEGPVAEGGWGRRPRFDLGELAVVTARHYFDCSDAIEIGERSVVGGLRSQFMTHSFDLDELEQDCAPIRIGPNSFVGTGCLLLGGSGLPENSLLAAGWSGQRADRAVVLTPAVRPRRSASATPIPVTSIAAGSGC